MVQKPKVRETHRQLSLAWMVRSTHPAGLILATWILAGQVAWANPLPKAIVRARHCACRILGALAA